MIAGAYWNNQGRYQKEYEQLVTLIPKEGCCDDPELEALRCMGKYYYDVHNNNALNIKAFHFFVGDLSNSLRALNVPIQHDIAPFTWNQDLDLLTDKLILLAWEKHKNTIVLQ